MKNGEHFRNSFKTSIHKNDKLIIRLKIHLKLRALKGIFGIPLLVPVKHRVIARNDTPDFCRLEVKRNIQSGVQSLRSGSSDESDCGFESGSYIHPSQIKRGQFTTFDEGHIISRSCFSK